MLEDGKRVPGHGGQGANAVVTAHDAARFAAAPRSHGSPVEYEDVADAQFNKGTGRTEAVDAGTDNDDLGRSWQLTPSS